MKSVLASICGAAASLALLTHAPDARALGPVDLEIAAKAGVGTNPDSTAPINPFGFGVGARGGVSFVGLYGGLSVIDYLGGSVGDLSEHALLYGLEAGYGFKVAIVTIRPQLGVGNAVFSTSLGSASNSASYLYLEPGVTGLVSLGLVFVGADLNALVIPSVSAAGSSSSKTFTSMTIHGQVGLRF